MKTMTQIFSVLGFTSSNDTVKAVNSGFGGLFNEPIYTIILTVLITLAIAGGLVWFFFFRGHKYPLYAIFNHEKISEFADYNGISAEKVLKYNHNIPSHYLTMPAQEKSKFIKGIKGTNLIIGYSRKKPTEVYSEQHHQFIFDDTPNFPVNQAKNFENIDNDSNKDVLSKLAQMENNLMRKIDILSEAKNNIADTRVNQLTNKLNELERENSNTTQMNDSLSAAKREQDIIVKQQGEQLNAANLQLTLIQEKYVAVPYLVEYNKSVLALFTLINEIYQSALKINQQEATANNSINYISGILLLKYSARLSTESGKWQSAVQDIVETGHTSQSGIIKYFRQAEQESEKLTQYKKAILKEALEKQASSILILAEEFSNFSRFLNVNDEKSQKIEENFRGYTQQLLARAMDVGMKIKYIPLFANYIAYAAHVREITQPRSLPYSGLQNLQKDTVAEITNYGVETPFETSDTLIILA